MFRQFVYIILNFVFYYSRTEWTFPMVKRSKMIAYSQFTKCFNKRVLPFVCFSVWPQVTSHYNVWVVYVAQWFKVPGPSAQSLAWSSPNALTADRLRDVAGVHTKERMARASVCREPGMDPEDQRDVWNKTVHRERKYMVSFSWW